MISNNDKILVAVSGGKDSTILALTLKEIQKKSKARFSFDCVLLDQKQPGFEVAAFREYMESAGLGLIIIEEDTYGIVKDKVAPQKSYCGLC